MFGYVLYLRGLAGFPRNFVNAMKKLNIKSRLLFVFACFGLLNILTFLLASFMIRKNEDGFREINNRNHLLQYYFLKDIKVTRDFFSDETINSAYFRNGESASWKQHLLMKQSFIELVNYRDKSLFTYGDSLITCYELLAKEFSTYCKLLDSIEYNINERRFKDYKPEGRMHQYAHQLQSKSELKSQQDLKKEIDAKSNAIESTLDTIYTLTYREGHINLTSILNKITLFWILITFLIVLISFWIAALLSRPLNLLKSKINDFIESDFTRPSAPSKIASNYEIDILSNQFSLLEQHIENQMTVLKSQNNELKLLIYRASHDLRSPFTAIKGAVNFALTRVKDKETSDILSKIAVVTDNFNDVVEELSAISDIKSSELSLSEVDLKEITDKCISCFQWHQDFKHVVFSTHFKSHGKIVTDERLLKMILRNLIENGIKYRNKERPLSEISISFIEGDDKLVQLTVSDNGLGIRKDIHGKVFEMFYRGTDVARGTGLGLYIVQNAIQKLSGAVLLNSEVGVGSTFTLFLPDLSEKLKVSEKIMRASNTISKKERVVLNFLASV